MVQTRPDRPGLVRVLASEAAPGLPDHQGGASNEPRVRYVGSFNDLDAAQMHAHAALRHGLVDVETHLYRADPLDAVAKVDAIELPHRVLYLDPALAAEPRFAALGERLKSNHRRVDWIWRAAGVAGILLLLLKLVLGF